MGRTMKCEAPDRAGVIELTRMREIVCVGLALLLAVAWVGIPSGSVEAQEPVPAPTPAPAPATTPAPTTTPAPAPAPEKWQFEVTPYFVAAGLDGTAGVAGVTADVDMGVGDILDRLDSAFMGAVEARKGSWGLLFDGVYFHLKGEGTRAWQGPGGIGTATGDLAADVTDEIFQLSLAKRVVDDGSMVDLIFGTRYTSLDSHLTLTTTTGGTLPGGSRSVSDQQSWWDPIFGFRLLFPFAERWTAVGYADLGGFGVGSDVTGQALAGINWEITKRFVAKGGYRALFQDYSDDGFVWEMAMHGFYAGVGIRF